MGIIDTYTNDIYELDLVVANKDVTLEELQELFVRTDNSELTDSITSNGATAMTVKRKKDGSYCELVKFNTYGVLCKTAKDRLEWLINTVGHEAGHYCLDLYYGIESNVCTTCQEPFCYLLGWATECIYKTWTKKTNDTLQKRKPSKR